MNRVYRSLAFAALSLTASAAQAVTSFCFVPGGSGGSRFIHVDTPKILAQKGIPFTTFHTDKDGPVLARAERLRVQFEQRLQQDPDFRCHLLASSYGGLTARFAYRHLSVRHPKLGIRPLADFIDTYTSLQSTNTGVEYIRPYAKIQNGEPNNAMQLTPEYVEMFTNPAYAGTYSPLPDAIPNYNFRTFVLAKREVIRFDESLIYRPIIKWLLAHDRVPMTDGLLTLDQQVGGFIIADLHLPHGFFNWKTPRKVGFTNIEFYEMYWNFLQKQAATPAQQQNELSPLEEFRDQLRARGIYSDPANNGPVGPIKPDL
jgi:hypothetical protein